MKEKIIFDCDPGIDDAIALALFSGTIKRSKEWGKKDIYIVATWGNVSGEQTLKNSILCREMFDLPAKVVRGMQKPVEGEPIHAKKIHGEDGLRGFSKNLEIKIENVIDIKELKEELENEDCKIEVIVTGPLSSLYLLLGSKIKEKIERIVWMGGAFFHDGNITPYAEFNSYCDPIAVEKLFEFAKERKCVFVVPIDATSKTQMKRSELLQIAEGTHIYDFLEKITEGLGTITLHDPLAVFSFFFPDEVKYFVSFSRVDTKAFRGKISSIISPNGFLKVIYDFDIENFKSFMKKAFEELEKEKTAKPKKLRKKE
ncbi:Pyrimidine-specific ribonucleoside hydrolase RihA [bacterium HR19]|nr:Pyrimidine-specific ribonucleoside hydrolase RihA [bacterium HR19]